MSEADIFAIAEPEEPVTADHENCLEEKKWEDYATQVEHGQMSLEEAEIRFSAWRNERLQQLGLGVLKAS